MVIATLALVVAAGDPPYLGCSAPAEKKEVLHVDPQRQNDGPRTPSHAVSKYGSVPSKVVIFTL